ncbi:ABC transporter ATP-binding protein [Paenibacillus vini]|uniref:HlyB/MsbA family ABC transporter n=1 Tax=Paenibacillus vini TaxID=1476024 RepID=A0ABQ4M6B3_9BACL|nr:ABC transporter ATP-binding protein [Paenibacillus vini]GIP51543.1 HlyB/MsbA family ABC transporter [Paenibacillus vini]
MNHKGVLRGLLFEIVPFIWKSAPVRLAVMMVIRIVEALQPAVQIYLTKRLVEQAAVLFQGNKEMLLPALTTISWQALFFLTALGLRSLAHMLLVVIKQKAQFQMDREIADKCSRLDYIYFEQSEYYDRLQRVTQGLAYRGLSVLDHFFLVLQSIITLVSLLFVLAGFHWMLSVGVLCLIIPSFLINMKLGQKRYKQMIEQTPSSRKVQYLMRLMTSRESAKEMKLFKLYPYIIDQWGKLYWKNAKEKAALEKSGQWLGGFSETFSYAFTALATVVVLLISFTGGLTIGVFVAMIQTVTTAKDSVMLIAANLSGIYENALFTSELIQFLHLPDKKPDERMELRKLVPGSHEATIGGLEVAGLSFTYPNQSVPALSDVEFHIKPGQRVAIVGHNGAGKSTLAKCLLGLYRPQYGNVLWNGKDIFTDEDAKLVSAVFQDFMQYQLTLKENIGFGQISALDNREQLNIAAIKTGVDFISHSLPQGYDTLLGHEYEGGKELSQGQWQKVALSRSFFNADAELVIYDEPTSALDPIAEAALFERFSELVEGKTSIMISHRLGSCRNADLILVLKDGRLVEQGTHSQLIQRQGEYARMYGAQSQWYDMNGVIA